MNDTNSFADDLNHVTTEVDNDISGILRAVKSVKQTTANPKPTIESNANATSGSEKNRSTRQAIRPSPEQSVALENVTTRLSKSTNERLTDAALHQRLKKTNPNSRQAIIEAAVCEWLSRHGYR